MANKRTNEQNEFERKEKPLIINISLVELLLHPLMVAGRRCLRVYRVSLSDYQT